jgi:hypothetical protein
VDTRECGWLGCGDSRCEPFCAGIVKENDVGKYNELYLTNDELRDVIDVLDTLEGMDLRGLSIDHVQLGDSNGEIVGKVQYEDGTWRFHARKHDKPATLGE